MIIALVLLGQRLPAASAAGELVLTVVDEKTRLPIPCRMHLVGPGKRPRKADPAPFWHDHFVLPGRTTLKLPVGKYTFEMQRGPEYLNQTGSFTIERTSNDAKVVELRRFADMSAEGWWSGDLYVRRPVRDAELLLGADDLHVAELVTWWNDASQWADRAPPKSPLVLFDRNRYYHVLAGGYARPSVEVLCLNLPQPLPQAQPEGEYPSLVPQLATVRQRSGAWVDLTASYWWDMPLLVAHGQVDSVQLAESHFCRGSIVDEAGRGKPRDADFYPGPRGMARWAHDVYFQLLECGLRIPPSAGSGSGVMPNPVGYNRAYVHVDGEFNYEKWWQNLRAGQVVVSNGPLLRPSVDGQLPGHVFQAEKGQDLELEIGLTLSTCDPISYLEIVQNGEVRHMIRFADYAKTGRLPKIHFQESGWFLLRVVAEVDSTYRFALTGPYYVEVGSQRRISRRAAQFFLDWLHQRARQIKLDDPQQRREVLDAYRKARDFWQDLVAKANAK
jgi:hypothetical protein